jgi:hypothetical protein
MPDPSILTALRSRLDSDSTEFCKRYDRFKALLAQQLERTLSSVELQELLLLRELMRRSLALQLEKRWFTEAHEPGSVDRGARRALPPSGPDNELALGAQPPWSLSPGGG